MTAFVDASVPIAIIAGGSDAAALADALQTHDDRLCSAISVWETIAGLSRSYNISLQDSRRRVHKFLDAGEFTFVSIGEAEGESATEAHIKFGKGHHRAALNMSDCLAYACAKLNQAKLLYRGNDFIQTDLA